MHHHNSFIRDIAIVQPRLIIVAYINCLEEWRKKSLGTWDFFFIVWIL